MHYLTQLDVWLTGYDIYTGLPQDGLKSSTVPVQQY